MGFSDLLEMGASERPSVRMMGFNLWGGCHAGPLLDYLVEAVERDGVRVLALQEVTSSSDSFTTSDGWVSDLRERIEERLGRDQFHWHWTQALQWTEGDKGQVGFGLLTAVHRSLGAIEVLPDELVAGAESWPGFANGQPIAYPMQRVRITGSTSGGWSSPLVLTNVHGVPRPVHKLDSEVRLEQNRRVRQHTDDA